MNYTVKGAVILALVITAAYSPIIFLDQSYNQAPPIPSEYMGHAGKSTLFGTVFFKYGDYQAAYPQLKLATNLFSKGELPLWNPYEGIGQPLAASDNHIFSPLNLGFFLPVELWDVTLLIQLWIAGFFTFLFIRRLGLNFVGSITGAIFYMLSGAFTWFLPNPNPFVTAFTPLIFYSLEKIIRENNPKNIVLGSVAFAVSILGSHLESTILQFILVGSYLSYRILSIVISNRYKNGSQHIIESSGIEQQTIKKIVSYSALAFLGGLGLSAFFILPMYELIENAHPEHDITFGTQYESSLVLSTGFVPYIFGQIFAYWIHPPPGTGIVVWGYVGVLSLFFSILSIRLTLKTNYHIHKYTPIFFLLVSIFFIMKDVGIPVVNWIGYLPVLNLVSFFAYVGDIIPFGFAVAAAFGIDLLAKLQIRPKTLAMICILTISVILLLLIPFYSYLAPGAKFPPYVTANDARDYVGFQVLQAIIFAIIGLAISIAVSKNRSSTFVIIPLVLLELSLYIPLGLHPIWMAYKAVIIITVMAVLIALILKPNRLLWSNATVVRLPVIYGILLIGFAGVVILSEASPFGMTKRYDIFEDNPVVNFFKENLGYNRMFSFDYTLGPNYPAAFGISTIGQLSPFNINSWYSFVHNFLDPDTNEYLGFPPWTYSYGVTDSIDTFQENKKYFDFLGVKYILIQGYGFDTIAPAIPGMSGQYSKIGPNVNSTGQSFISPIDTIGEIGASLGSSMSTSNDVILAVDSVPYDKKYHRESLLNQTIINQQYAKFFIIPPLSGVQDKQLYLSLKFPHADVNNLLAVFTVKQNQTGYDFIKNKLNGKFYENGKLVEGKQMVFSITPAVQEHPSVFKFHNINIYENKEAFPRAFLVARYTTVEEGKAQEYLKKHPDFDLRNNVVLEKELPKKQAELIGSSLGIAKIVSLDANLVKVKIENKDASLLVLTDTYYPGWKAYVDSNEVEIYRANGLVRAVFVPAGNHNVEFVYMPESFVTGSIISLVSVVALAGIYLYGRKNHVMSGSKLIT